GRGLVDPPPHPSDDLVDRPPKVVLGPERGRRLVDLAPALDVHGPMAVHHDLRDVRIPDERLERPETEDVVADLLDDVGLLLDRQGDLLFAPQLSQPAVDPPAK